MLECKTVLLFREANNHLGEFSHNVRLPQCLLHLLLKKDNSFYKYFFIPTDNIFKLQH